MNRGEPAAAALAGTLPAGANAHKPKWLDRRVVKNFKYRFYASRYGHKVETLHRAGNERYALGQCWSRDIPHSQHQVRQDKTLPYYRQDANFDEGCNPDELTVYDLRNAAEFGPRTTMYTGLAVRQRDGKETSLVLLGGTQRILIPSSERNHRQFSKAKNLESKKAALAE